MLDINNKIKCLLYITYNNKDNNLNADNLIHN